MNKIKLRRFVCIMCCAVMSFGFMHKVQAQNDYVPELMITKEDSDNTKINIGVYMSSSDRQVYKDFSSAYNFNIIGGSRNTNGNQTIEDGKYHLHDTMTNHEGNAWWSHYGDTCSDISRLYLKDIIYPNNGQWLAISLRVKSVGGTYTMLGSCTEANKQTYKGTETLPFTYAEDVDFSKSKPTQVKVNIPDNIKNTGKWNVDICTYLGVNKNNRLQESVISGNIDTSNGIMYLNEYWSHNNSLRSSFKVGDKVLSYNWCNTNKEQIIPNDGQWHTINYNVRLVDDTDLYDFPKDGMRTYFYGATNGDLYIDEVSIGYASKVEVVRDSDFEHPVYCGYDSEFIDTGVSSKNSPNSPTVYADTYSYDAEVDYSAPVKNNKHTYVARSLGRNGDNPSNWSSATTVDFSSIPDKYHLKLYKNDQVIKDEETKDTKQNITGVKRGDILKVYIETIDTLGRKSETSNFEYCVGQTADDLINDIKVYLDNIEMTNDTKEKELQQELTLLRTNNNVPYNVNEVSKEEATKYKEGKITTNCSIANQNKVMEVKIKCKPIYQTKDEYKKDIKDYTDNI